MLQLINRTCFTSEIFLMSDPSGIESLYTVVKGTFSLRRGLVVSEDQTPVALKDEYYGGPNDSSLRTAHDLSLIKPGTDVVVQGHARTPRGRAAGSLDVSITVGRLQKTVRVFGDRRWRSTGGISEPRPFTEMPLTWERAFGGRVTMDNGRPGQTEPRNPVGVGFRAGGSQAKATDTMLPNLEDPVQLIASPKDCPTPACFAPIGPNWEPRRRFAGTYDEVWVRRRAPYLPLDFDPRFFNIAPTDLIAPEYLRGDEIVSLFGVSTDGVLRFALPAVDILATYRLDSRVQTCLMRLDGVVVKPDDAQVVLTWRSTFACNKQALRIREVEVASASMSQAAT